ncbi:pyruvate dehydrogenase (acetyl-transferring), homodimeric type, partial [Streptomyces sp. DSM 41529]|nr:pyruvate dehydrogenase (acetyl-transferring), homodimeric type [Streptomyces sp. DSM 41529]
FQTYATETGAYIREHFFGDDPRLRDMVKDMTDQQILHLGRGGHDHRKVYAAYAAAKAHKGQPTVILAQTVKGWTLGPNFEGRNATHQMKKLTVEDLKRFRDRLHIPITDKQLDEGYPPYYHPGRDSEEIQYMHDRRNSLGGYVPTRVVRAKPLPQPEEKTYAAAKKGSGSQSIATTMAFVRILKDLMRDKEIGKRFVLIAPDEYRTFG